ECDHETGRDSPSGSTLQRGWRDSCRPGDLEPSAILLLSSASCWRLFDRMLIKSLTARARIVQLDPDRRAAAMSQRQGCVDFRRTMLSRRQMLQVGALGPLGLS